MGHEQLFRLIIDECDSNCHISVDSILLHTDGGEVTKSIYLYVSTGWEASCPLIAGVFDDAIDAYLAFTSAVEIRNEVDSSCQA